MGEETEIINLTVRTSRLDCGFRAIVDVRDEHMDLRCTVASVADSRTAAIHRAASDALEMTEGKLCREWRESRL